MAAGPASRLRPSPAATLVLAAVAVTVVYGWRSATPVAIDLAAVLDAEVESLDRDDGGRFRLPTAEEADQLAAAWREVQAGHLGAAAELAEPVGYDVRRYRDRVTGRPVVLLTERVDDPARRRGWGLYVFAPQSQSPLVVEVAHPVSDAATEKAGLETFRRADGRALLLAGARRDAGERREADVAHEPATAFHRLHRETVTSSAVVYQPHGYADATAPDYEVVVSSGDRDPTHLTTEVAEKLEEAGFDVCLYNGRRCRGLGATTNVQGTDTRSVPGAEFLHVEMARRVRDDRERRRLVARVVADSAAAPGGR